MQSRYSFEVCTDFYVYTCILVFSCTCTRMHTYIHTYLCMYMYLHTRGAGGAWQDRDFFEKSSDFKYAYHLFSRYKYFYIYVYVYMYIHVFVHVYMNT